MAETRLPQTRRDATIARLSDAFAGDHLTLDEFEQRVTLAYKASSEDELTALLSGLPVPATAKSAQVAKTDDESKRMSPAEASAHQSIRCTFGNIVRSGIAELPAKSEIKARFGNVELDLRSARIASRVTEISISAFAGNVVIQLPPDVRLEDRGAGFLGSFQCYGSNAKAADESVPLVRITGRSVLSNIEVHAQRPAATMETKPDE